MDFSTLAKKYRLQCILVATSAMWLMVFAFLTQISFQEIIYPDSYSYWVAADNLYAHLRGHNFRPILMAAISGIPYLFGGGQSQVFGFSFYVNLVCWIGSVLATFAILREILPARKAFYFTLVTILIVGNVSLIFHLLTETLYLFAVMMSFWLLVRYESNKRFNLLAIAIALLLLTMLIRPGGMVFAVVVTLWYWRPIFQNLQSRWQLFLGGALLLIFVQCAGMKHQFGNFTLSYIDAVTYYNYLGSKAAAFDEGKVFSQENNPRTTAIYPLQGPQQKMHASADFKNQLLNNTDDLFLAYADNLLENSKTGSTAISDCKNVRNSGVFAAPTLFWISKWQNRFLSVAGFLLGMFFLFRRNETSPFRVMAFFVLCTIFLSGISCSQGDRFHVVTFPTVIVLFAKLLTVYPTGVKRFAAPLQKGWRFLP